MHFKASNGTEIIREVFGNIVMRERNSRSEKWLPVDNDVAVALGEFFEMEADQILKRWRWPENVNYVVYPSDNGWLVLNELDGHTKHYTHREHVGVGGSNMTRAARAYFDAHPESKPWHDAKTGEVWVIKWPDGTESAWTVNNQGKFESPDSTYQLANPNITAARRIWPQVTF